jgi:sugar lactone lactonase YvrE
MPSPKTTKMKKTILFTIAVAALAGCIAIEPTQRISFEAPDLYPEGIAFDSTRNLFHVSSARLGQVGSVSPSGTYTVLHRAPDLKSTYGMKMHPNGKHLLVCVGDANYSKFTSADTRAKLAKLISIDVTTGARIMDIDLSKLIPGKHFVNDMAIDNSGNIYLTDSYAHAIYRVSPDGKATVFAKSPLFETAGIGLNGIVYHPAGFLLADNTNTGQLYKIDISNPQNVQKVKTDQYFLGADGLL